VSETINWIFSKATSESFVSGKSRHQKKIYLGIRNQRLHFQIPTSFQVRLRRL